MSEHIRNAVRVAGFSATPLFALYNGALGLWYGAVWHGSICGYYLTLSLLRFLLLAAERGRKRESQALLSKERRIFYVTSAILLLMNIALVVPVSLMVLDRRPVRLGLIPAIATATYTTYKVTAASFRLKRPKSSIYTHQLDRLGFVDALVSVLVLQNTLLTTVDGAVTAEMFPLVAVTSAAILFVVFTLSVIWFVRSAREV